MDGCYQAAQALLTSAARSLGLTVPDPVPLRLGAEEGLLRSALPRRLAAETGGDAEVLAERLAAAASLQDAPFSAVTAEGGMLLLSLSEDWLRSVLARFETEALSPLPAMPRGVRERNEEDPDFLLAYTARRCRFLAARGWGEKPEALPAGVICALAAGDREGAVRRYWRLPPGVRAYPPLANAVGIAAGDALRGFHG